MWTPNFFRNSLLKRALAGNFFLLLVCVSVLTTVFLSNQRRAIENQFRLRAVSLAEIVAGRAEFPLLVGDKPHVAQIAADALENSEVLSVTIADAAGSALAHQQRPGFMPTAGEAGIHGTGASRYIEVTRTVYASNSSGLGDWEGSNRDKHALGLVRLDLSLSQENDLFSQTLAYAVLFASLSLACILGFQYLQLRRAFLPLKDLMVFTREVGAGNLALRMTVRRLDETGELSAAFNHMLDRLGETTVSKANVDNILESIAEALLVLDGDGVIRTANPAAARLFGYSLPELIGMPISVLAKDLRVRECMAVDENFLAKDGRTIPVMLSVSAVHLHGADGLVLVMSDMSERRQVRLQLESAKEAAEQANIAKSAFLANMSHELRTPLNAVIGYSELLMEQIADQDPLGMTEDLARIRSAGKHQLTLINDILDISKIEAGRIELHLETFDFAAIIRDVVSTVSPIAAKNNTTLQLDCPAVLEMRADMTKIRQCLLNLVGNAAKFTENGSIEVRSFALDEWLICEIKDSGIGMTPDQMERLFKPFTQGDSSTTRRYGGTGLGLAISQKLCHMMGGSISAESEAGRGSTFTLRVPKWEANLFQSGLESLATVLENPVTASDGLPTVLVIDDDPQVHDLVTRFLSKQRCRVVTAASGTEGLRLARSLRPAAITLDVIMPGMDGWSVLMALKADPELASIPVILVSITDDRSRGYSLGAVGYLTKPLSAPDFLATVRSHLPHPLAAGGSNGILVVEDDEPTRSLMVRMLRQEGWPVMEAVNGRDGLAKASERTPSLMLVDLMMPEMDGVELITTLRSRGSTKNVPIVVVTAKELTVADRLRLHGTVLRILQKGSYKSEELLTEVRGVIEPVLSQPEKV